VCHIKFVVLDLGLSHPLFVFQLEAGVPLPSPAMLKRKIIIKNKKRHSHKCEYDSNKT